jgi:RNA polymerase sigma-70 factor, ECF subfamily
MGRLGMLTFLTVIDCEEIRNQLEEIYYLYGKDLWYISNDILNDEHEAEDIVQTALIKITGYLDKNIDVKEGKTKGLIAIIVRNLSINLYNQRKRRPTVDIDELEEILEEQEDQNPEPKAIRLDKKKWIAGELAKIKPEYADILALKYEYEYSDKEISDICSLDEGNVRVRLCRAKKALQNIMGGDFFE